MTIRHRTAASALLFLCGLASPWAALLTSWLIYPVIVLPALFFILNGLKGGVLLNTGFIPLFLLSLLLTGSGAAGAATGLPAGMVLIALLLNLPIGFFYERECDSGRHRLSRQLYSDSLTGLPNRKQLIADLQRSRTPVLFLINIDDFKEINNVFGPKAGDTILYELSVLIAGIIEELPCGFYKLGADEYALLMEKSQNDIGRAGLTRLAEKISRTISAANFSIDSSEIRLRATIGIGDSRIDGRDNIMAQADMALKSAKAGFKPFLFFTQTIDTRENYQKNIHSLRILTEALENNRIVPYYMPIVSRINGRTETYECLARLIDPDGTVYPPGFFLDIARKSRLYSQITRIMFRKAADYFNDLPHRFTINISMDDMNDPQTVSTILEILQSRPRLENRVIFEILESESINNYPQVSTFIQLVKAYGCRIAIDDFGSGYSNFEYIPRLNIDFLKINGELIRNIGKNRQNRFIVENIHNFASGLGIETVAEYVEDEEILKELLKIKVDYLQGYYFGAPAVTIRTKEVARIH